MSISVKEYQSRLSQVLNQSTIESLVSEIVLSDQTKLKAEKINEFTKGERPDESIIGTYQDADYAFFKHAINPMANGNVDLMLSRSFVNKMFVKNFSNGFIFDSTDSKTGALIGKYGLDIMGLNQEWFNKRQNDIYRLTLVFTIKKKYKIA